MVYLLRATYRSMNIKVFWLAFKLLHYLSNLQHREVSKLIDSDIPSRKSTEEAYWEPIQITKIKLLRFSTVNFFCKRLHLRSLVRFLNAPLHCPVSKLILSIWQFQSKKNKSAMKITEQYSTWLTVETQGSVTDAILVDFWLFYKIY